MRIMGYDILVDAMSRSTPNAAVGPADASRAFAVGTLVALSLLAGCPQSVPDSASFAFDGVTVDVATTDADTSSDTGDGSANGETTESAKDCIISSGDSLTLPPPTSDGCSASVACDTNADCCDGNPCTDDSCAPPDPSARDSLKGSCVHVLSKAIACQHDMAFLPAGVMAMGGGAPVDWCPAVAQTPHWAVFDQGFFIDRREVSRAEFDAVAGSLPGNDQCDQAAGCQQPTGSNDLPRTCVTWAMANQYCFATGERRLCTEAEWEYAARGGKAQRFLWGDDLPPAPCEGKALKANVADCKRQAPWEVGSACHSGSPFDGSLCDFAGNVAEWVLDSWAAYPKQTVHVSAAAASTNSIGCVERVVRGGAWSGTMDQAAAYARDRAPEGLREPKIGLRCCMNAYEAPQP